MAKKKTVKKTTKKPVAKKTAARKPAPKKKAAPVKAKTKVVAKPKTMAKPVVKPVVKAVKAAPMTSVDIQPLDDRLIVEIVANDTVTAGGIIIPDSALDSDKPMKGTVLSVGRGRKNKKGATRPMDVSKGDTVLFARFAGSMIKLNLRDVCILRESDILGIVEK